MSDPYDRIWVSNQKKVEKMFVYLIHLTSGESVRVESSGDPTDHPTFFGRVASVETLGESGKLLHLVWAMSDPYARLDLFNRKEIKNVGTQ